MTQPAALPDLNDVAARSGFDKEMVAFLKQKGISNSGLFLHFFKDSANIGPFWEPLRAGVEINGSTIKKSDDERLILEAATKVALDELTLLHTQLMSPTATASASPSGSQAQASQSEATEKVPKVLPKNYWSEYVKEFESVTLVRTEQGVSSPPSLRSGGGSFQNGASAPFLRSSTHQFA